MNTDLLPVPFRETTLYLVDHQGQPYTPMKPIVEGMGLAWAPQFSKLTEDEKRWSITMIVMVAVLQDLSKPRHAGFSAGFLLHRGRFRLERAPKARAFLSTG